MNRALKVNILVAVVSPTIMIALVGGSSSSSTTTCSLHARAHDPASSLDVILRYETHNRGRVKLRFIKACLVIKSLIWVSESRHTLLHRAAPVTAGFRRP